MFAKIVRLNYDFVINKKKDESDQFCVNTKQNQNVFVVLNYN
jgi:hypothetical protein